MKTWALLATLGAACVGWWLWSQSAERQPEPAGLRADDSAMVIVHVDGEPVARIYRSLCTR